MPELAEMDTYKSLLNQKLVGRSVSNIEINREKSINVTSSDFVRELMEKQILKIERRA